jgi:subtilase family serine protease
MGLPRQVALQLAAQTVKVGLDSKLYDQCTYSALLNNCKCCAVLIPDTGAYTKTSSCKITHICIHATIRVQHQWY